MHGWRLVCHNEFDGPWNMAIDEVMLSLRARKAVPDTLRLYRFEPSSVTIGYFQSAQESVNLAACDEHGLQVVRRPTGGGAVYHDTDGEITYAVVASKDDPLIPDDIAKSYETICKGIVLAMRSLGLEAEFEPVNDVSVKGRKVSGSAQTRRHGAVLQHGTVMYDTNIDVLASVLPVPLEKLTDKGVLRIEERVTTISRALGREVRYDEVMDALVKGFAEALNASLRKGVLTDQELQLAEKLVRTKYAQDSWNFMV